MRENSSLGTSEPTDGAEAVCIADHKREMSRFLLNYKNIPHIFIRENYQLPELQNVVNVTPKQGRMWGSVFTASIVKNLHAGIKQNMMQITNF